MNFSKLPKGRFRRIWNKWKICERNSFLTHSYEFMSFKEDILRVLIGMINNIFNFKTD